MKFYGTIAINENDEIFFLSSYQNEMFNYYESLDCLSLSQEILKERAHLSISNETLENLYSIIKHAEWKTGKCYGQKVNSYTYFHVSNDKYSIPEDNKRR
jgi:hypothetical protein